MAISKKPAGGKAPKPHKAAKTAPPASVPRRVHFIGICGVAMSAVASAMAEQGWKVSGSDAGFFPPVSTNLTRLGIPYYAGWHPEKMGAPDIVVVGNAVSSQNPEVAYVEEHNKNGNGRVIEKLSYPEALGRFFIKDNSIVCAGTYGKTTSSALLTHILRHAGMHPSYMIGGVPEDGSPAAAIDTGDWSVVEGDEYTTAKWDPRPKFAHYKPTHLLLTAVKWDHADVYPTEKSYFDAFRGLIKSVPAAVPAAKAGGKGGAGGLIVACTDTETLPKLLAAAKRPYVSYGKSPDATYRYENVTPSRAGISFDIIYHGKTYTIKSRLLGAYNAENIAGCFALAREIGIAPGDITDAIASFGGLKRRLEKRYEHEVAVIDDIAHSPEKARSALANIRDVYPGLVIAVYEPNIGNRTPQSKPAYEGAFRAADTVVIPRLSKLKIDRKGGRKTPAASDEKTFDGAELAETIRAGSHNDVHYIDDDQKLVEFITHARGEGDVIAFLGSHGFRGMIEETIKKLAGK